MKERHLKINFYIGKAYVTMKRPLKVCEHWTGLSAKDDLGGGTNIQRRRDIRAYLNPLKELRSL